MRARATDNNPIPGYLAATVLLLMATGAVFVFSASANVTQDIDLRRFYGYPALRQLLFFPAAVLIMYAMSRLDYRWLRLKANWSRSVCLYLLAASVSLLVVVLIPRFGAQVNYARRWLRIALGPVSVSFQPSELAKWSLVLFLAAFGARYEEKLRSYWQGFVPLCILVAVIAGLIILEDFGTAALVCLLAFLMLVLSGARWLHLLSPFPIVLAAFAAAILSSQARSDRILAFLHPDRWTDTINYQPSQSLIALGSGGLFGRGLGMGVCKYGHLPEDTTDFIFAIIGEELGFIGAAAVILMFVVFVWLGMLTAIRCRDKFGRLLAAGIVLTVGVQAALNIGVVTVVLPTKGLPLPFVSAGGTSLVLSAAAAGVLINIAKQSPKQALEELE